MSTTLDTFADAADTCPHGVEGVDADPLRCSHCWLGEQSGKLTIDDPRREQ